MTNTVRANALAEPGERQVFLQIIDPEDNVLTADPPLTFTFDGEQFDYSLLYEFDYQNEDLVVCATYDHEHDYLKGRYQLVLFGDDLQYEPRYFDMQ